MRKNDMFQILSFYPDGREYNLFPDDEEELRIKKNDKKKTKIFSDQPKQFKLVIKSSKDGSCRIL